MITSKKIYINNLKEKLLPYWYLGRFHITTGTLLLLLPSYWSLALNSSKNLIFTLYYYIIFALGAFCMRAFGCIINDYIDKDIDKKVARTKNRPLANDTLGKKEAFIFALILLIIPILIWLSFNTFAKIVALSSLILVVIYPFTKRFLQTPQLILGLTFNWGILLADAALNNRITLQSFLLYVSAIIWTIAYDTIYAYQDYEDDKKIGVRSTALLIGENPKKVIAIAYLIMFILLVIMGLIYLNKTYIILLALSFTYIYYSLYTLTYKDSNSCFIFFKRNVIFATIIWLAILLG